MTAIAKRNSILFDVSAIYHESSVCYVVRVQLVFRIVFAGFKWALCATKTIALEASVAKSFSNGFLFVAHQI